MSTKANILEFAKANRLATEPPEGFIFRRGGDYPEEREFMVLEDSENISTLIDRLFRITTKVTEGRAGDIMLVLNALDEAREKGEPYCKLLSFWDHGVNPYDAGFDADSTLFIHVPEGTYIADNGLDGIQYWLLAYAPGENGRMEKGKTLLKRYNFSGPYWNGVQPNTDFTD